MMGSLPSSNTSTSLGSTSETESIWTAAASRPKHPTTSLPKNSPSSTPFGTNSKSTSTNTIRAPRDSSSKPSSKPSSSKCCRKPPNASSTTFSGTCSEWTPTPTKRSISWNSYFCVYLGPFHPAPRRRDFPSTLPQAATSWKEQSELPRILPGHQ